MKAFVGAALVSCVSCVSGLALAGCGNRAVDERIAILGDEDPNNPPSEFHRPGQPCVLCHGEYLRETPIMSVGGTIYAVPTKDAEKPLPVKGVTVKMTDSFGEQYEVGTNCAGNFYVVIKLKLFHQLVNDIGVGLHHVAQAAKTHFTFTKHDLEH